jgi:hypothetical protein
MFSPPLHPLSTMHPTSTARGVENRHQIDLDTRNPPEITRDSISHSRRPKDCNGDTWVIARILIEEE